MDLLDAPLNVISVAIMEDALNPTCVSAKSVGKETNVTKKKEELEALVVQEV